jgi:hypothetical protein
MGIKIRNLSQLLLHLKSSGTLTAATYKDLVKVPFAGFISNVVAKVIDGGSGAGPSIADIHLNGTTIFGAATKINIAATTGVITYGTFTTDPVQVAAGDVLSLDVDSISTAPISLIVTMTLTKTPPAATGSITDHNLVQ